MSDETPQVQTEMPGAKEAQRKRVLHWYAQAHDVLSDVGIPRRKSDTEDYEDYTLPERVRLLAARVAGCPDEGQRVVRCPSCGRVASVPEWCARPICVHAWDGYAPEVWDGDDHDGRRVEDSPYEPFRTAGPNTWMTMLPVAASLPADEEAK